MDTIVSYSDYDLAHCWVEGGGECDTRELKPLQSNLQDVTRFTLAQQHRPSRRWGAVRFENSFVSLGTQHIVFE